MTRGGRRAGRARMDRVSRYAVVIFPEADTRDVEDFRTQWDPQASTVAAHVTLAFPFDWPGTLDELVTGLAPVAAAYREFPLSLEDARIWADEYVFLLAAQGNDEIATLHRALYTGPLAHLPTPSTFIPHMTIGRQPNPWQAHTTAKTLRVSGRATAVTVYRVEPGACRTGVTDLCLSPAS